ncbi:MAG: hypothetical protein QQN41_04740 [Nitrosopumilus sp.]
MAKASRKLVFGKQKSSENNYKEFEKYVLSLDKKFGKILLSHINDSAEEIRDNVKEDILKLICNK